MQVLVKNHLALSKVEPQNVIESFWSEKCLYLGANFSMSLLMDLSDPVSLSPFLVLDAKVAFLISQLNPVATTYARQLGPLGLIGAHLMTNSKFIHEEDPKKIGRYLDEYLPKSQQDIVSGEEKYDQVVVFGESVVKPELWNKLKVGGFYILASDKAPITIDLSYEEFEAFGKRWPYGQPTEFGWRFKEEEWGLKDYEFAKIRKLS